MLAGLAGLAACDVHTEFTEEQHTGHTGLPRWAAAACGGPPPVVADLDDNTEKGGLPWPSRGVRLRRSCRRSKRRALTSSTSGSVTCLG